MKTLKFTPDLVVLILKGEKTTTWRLWDDKDLQVGDELLFLDGKAKNEFAKARLILITEKPFKNITRQDLRGHEKFKTEEEMYRAYSNYYGREVTKDTLVKIINFELI